MTASVFTAAQLRLLAAAGPEAALFRAEDGRCWLNSVTKDHVETLIAEVHDHEIDIYLVLEGEGDLFLGGMLLDPTTPTPGQHRGSGLRDAARHPLAPGDLIVIPPGTPHMVDARASRLVYVVVKHVVEPPLNAV